MTQWTVPTTVEAAPQALEFDDPGNAAWIATPDGRVVTVRLLDSRVTVRGGGYVDPVLASPRLDGLGVAVVERGGQAWVAHRDRAGKDNAVLAATLPATVLAVRSHPDKERLLVLGAGGTLVVLDLATGATTPLATVADAVTLAVDDHRNEAVLLTDTGGQQRLVVVDLGTGLTQTAPQVLAGVSLLISPPDPTDHGVLAVDEVTGRVTLIHFDQTPGAITDFGTPISALARWGSLLLGTVGTTLRAVEWNLDAGPLTIALPLGPLFVGGYSRIGVNLAAAGQTLDSVQLIVDGSPDNGSFSAGREPSDADGVDHVMLLAGPIPGEFRLEVREIGSGSVLARGRFRVTTVWPDEYAGPPEVVTGEDRPFAGGGFGGGAPGPQNIKVFPAPEFWNVALVLVSTKDKRFSADTNPIRARWRNRLVGNGKSARIYYEEVSLRNTPLGGPTMPKGTTIGHAANEVFGPIDLDLGWGDLFDPWKKEEDFHGWKPKDTGWRALASAFSDFMADRPDAASVMKSIDAVVFILPVVSAGPVTVGKDKLPAQFIWPQAWGTKFAWKDPATSTYTQASKPVALMPDGLPALMPAEKQLNLDNTLCHELGHTFGCDDLYNRGDFPAEVAAREPSNVDVMASSFPLPHFSLPNKMRLGWIAKEWVEPLDFSKNASPKTITLHATEALTRVGPPPGRKSGIEIRVRDGWNYYFEYRRAQAGQVGDQDLQTPPPGSQRLILGTDVQQPGGEPAHPSIMLIPIDDDGDGPELTVPGTDYAESDVTNPTRMFDFHLRLVNFDPVDPNAAQVAVEYVESHRPDLEIHPAPGRGNFKSPDIDIDNGVGPNFVIKGMPHRVIARVHNAGTLTATDVLVKFRWLPFTTSPGAWSDLPTPARKTVPAKSTVTFETTWTPPKDLKLNDVPVQHFCVRVDIERYRDPLHPEHDEINVSNNWAQSNFDTLSLLFGSPSERRRTAVNVTNSLSRQATYLTVIQQDHALYRTYVGQAWQRLNPGESRAVELCYESLAGDLVHGAAFDQAFEEHQMDRPNRVAISSHLLGSEDNPCRTAREWWGAGLEMRAAHACWFEEVRVDGELLTATLLGSLNGVRVPVDDGIAQVVAWSLDTPDDGLVSTGVILPGGHVRVILSSETMQAMHQGPVAGMVVHPATYFWGQAVSEEVRLN